MDNFQRINVVINGKEVANEIGAIIAAKKKLNAEINRMEIGSEAYIERVQDLARLNNVLAQHRNAIGATSDSVNSLVGSIKGVGVAALAAFTVENVIAFGKELFKTATSMETMGRKAAIVFGDSISIVEQFATTMSDSLGQSRSETIEATTAIGDLLIPMGFAREQAAVLSTQLVSLSGALSEWTGGQKDAKEVSATLTKALLGEREELKSLGIAISEDNVKAVLAAEGKAKLTGKALEQAKAMATLKLIMEKSQDAQTNFAQNSDSLVRSQARLQSSLATIKETLAAALIPFFSQAASAVAGIIAPSKKASESTRELQNAFNLEVETLKKGNMTKENRKLLINQINAKYKEFLPNLLTEKSTIEEITRVQNLSNQAFDRKITMMAAEEGFVAAQKEILDLKRKDLELALGLTKAQQEYEASKARINNRAKADKNETGSYLALQNSETLLAAENAKKINDDAIKNAEENYQKLKAIAIKAGATLSGLSGASPTSSTDGAASEKEKSKLAAALKAIQDIYQKHFEDLAQLRVSDYDAGILAIEQKYEEEKRKASEALTEFKGSSSERAVLEKKTNQLIVNLEKLKNEELTIYRREQGDKVRTQLEEQALKDTELNAKLQSDDLAQNKLFLEQRGKDKVDFEAKLKDKFALTESEDPFAKYQKELDLLKGFYDESLVLADEFGVDITDITAQYEAKRGEITTEGQEKVAKTTKENAAKRIESFNKEIAALSSAFESFGDLFTAMSDLVSSEGEKSATFTKALTLFQIAMDTASAIASLTRASEANPANAATFGAAGTAQFITGLARILTNVGKAKKLLTEKEPKKQKFMGGFQEVVGATDGRSYNAQYIGQPRTGLLNYNTPVLTASNTLANERGREYYVSASDVSNPYVLSKLNDIERYKGRTTQFAEGGFNAIPDAPSGGMSELVQVVLLLTQKIERLEAKIIWTDDDTIRFRERYLKLQDASGNKYTL